MPAPDRWVGGGRWQGPIVALAAGLALGASWVDFRLWVVPWVAVAPLVALAESRDSRRAFRLGWLGGLAGIGCAFSWLVYAFQVFGGFSLALALALFVLPVGWMALEIALFTGLLAWLGPLPLGLAAPVTFTMVELVFPTLFPWRIAHTQSHIVTLLQTGEIAGPYLLGFAIVWVNAGIVSAVRRRERGPLMASGALVMLLVLYGVARVVTIDAARAAAPRLRVGVVQGNIGVERKGDRTFFRRNLDDYRRLSSAIAADVDLLVWPETVAQRPIPKDARTPPADSQPFPDAPRPLVFGGLTIASGPDERRLYNSAFLMEPDGSIVGRYDKRVLVPFGEYLPLATRFPWLRRLSPATGHFTPGSGPALLTVGDDIRIGALICYEDVIPGPAREAVEHGATLLLNLTNDAWYGASAEPYQHHALALWRAVETRRDFIRSTNTGLTAAISATGRSLGDLPIFVAATMLVETRLLALSTFYVRWGDVFAWAIALIWVLAAARRLAALKTPAP
ncbi:MAG: apolipoprotein N-acyltransferase [Candidatus Binatia bacterium]